MAERFDVVIVGAGIHGAGVAQAAAARGYSVLVLEQHAPASGTSSRSSKLIHGGLRYLESGQFALVRECLREREILLRIAPGLVRLVPFHIPIYRNSSRRPWQIRAGLSLYAALGGFGANFRFSALPRARWDALDGLATHDLQAVFRYSDAQTDDAALTRAVLHSAQSLGAELRAPAEFLAATIRSDRCSVRYAHGGATQECETRVLVNAAGPWVAAVAQRIEPRPALPPVDLVQGTHIVVDGNVDHGIYYVEAPRDRRAVFVMPWRGGVMIGTTETHYDGEPGRMRPLQHEIDYLLETYGAYFPRAVGATPRESFAGLRVLPRATSAVFHRPRDTLIVCDAEQQPKVVNVVGGKLTAYRATAAKVVDTFAASLPARAARGDTARLRLLAV